MEQSFFDASVLSKSQERLHAHAVAALFFAEVAKLARRRPANRDDATSPAPVMWGELPSAVQHSSIITLRLHKARPFA